MSSLKFVLYSLVAVAFTFIIHEFTHWTAGELLGYDMRMTLNTAYPADNKYTAEWHDAVISAVGPLITLLQAFIFYTLIKKYSNRNLFPFLFTCFYMTLMAGIMNLINPNDLGRIGQYMNIGLLTLPAIFVAIHSTLLFKTVKQENYRAGFILATVLLIMLFSSILILANQKYHIRLI